MRRDRGARSDPRYAFVGVNHACLDGEAAGDELPRYDMPTESDPAA